jgi:hypothetical protein
MQVWTNVWKKRGASPFDSDPYYVTAKNSYDDAMEDIYESGEQFSLPAVKYNLETKKSESYRQYYDYVCTQFSQFDKNGKLLETKTHTDLADYTERWNREREADEISYLSAATLSASQLCKVGSF